MNQEIEIEFKNLLTEEEFKRLVAYYSIRNDQFILQENHYFDTESFSLKERDSALRIRFKQYKYTLTLKQQVEEGILETHQYLTEEEAAGMLSGGPLIKGDIYNLISSLHIDPELISYLGTLETSRVEMEYKDGILVFDHSRYLDTDDYEVEYEVKEFEKGKERFDFLLNSHSIPHRKTDNKIKRFFNAKLKQADSGEQDEY